MNRRAGLLLLTLSSAGCASGGMTAKPTAVVSPKARASAPVDESFRATAPPPEPATTFSVPVPQAFVLPNGMNAVLIERHDLPLVALQVLVPHGTDDVRPRLGSFAMEAILRGNRDADGRTARERLDAIAVSTTSWGSLDSVGVKIQCVRDKLEPALAIVADALARPTFEARDIELIRGELLATFDNDKSAIGTVHGWATRSALYPLGHPYRDAGTDRAADIRAVTRADVARFAKSHLTPNGMTAVVAGDITSDALRAALAAAFESWTGEPTRRPPPPPPVPRTADATRRVFLVDRRGAAQTHVSVVAPSIARSAEDYPAMLVFNRILGGSVSSRLFKNLREQKGLTYWVGSQLTTRHGVGELSAGGAVVKDKSAVAIREIMNEIGRLSTEPVPPAELGAATAGLVQELPAMFEALGSVLWSYGEAPVHGLPPDELSGRSARIAAVTSEDVMTIAKNYFDRTAFRVVVTGDASVVRKDLEQLDLGPVQSLEPVPAKR